MKKLLFLLLIAPFVFAYYKKPLLNEHKAKIYTVAVQAESAVDDDVLARPEWDNLEFRDWTIATATQDKEKHSMVSFGIATWVKIVDTDWAPKAFGLKSRNLDEKK